MFGYFAFKLDCGNNVFVVMDFFAIYEESGARWRVEQLARVKAIEEALKEDHVID